MPSASVVKELNCTNCGKPLVINGRVKCPRCKQQVELPVSLPEGKWFCLECPAHGEKPHVLAINGQIKCRWCGEDKNSLIQKEEEMATNKVVEVLDVVKNFSLGERKELVKQIRDLPADSLLHKKEEAMEKLIERLNPELKEIGYLLVPIRQVLNRKDRERYDSGKLSLLRKLCWNFKYTSWVNDYLPGIFVVRKDYFEVERRLFICAIIDGKKNTLIPAEPEFKKNPAFQQVIDTIIRGWEKEMGVGLIRRWYGLEGWPEV